MVGRWVYDTRTADVRTLVRHVYAGVASCAPRAVECMSTGLLLARALLGVGVGTCRAYGGMGTCGMRHLCDNGCG